MIDHVTIRVSDLERSYDFYKPCLAALGHQWAFGEEGIFHAFDVGSGCLFEIAKANEKSALTPVHIALRAKDRQQVEAFYRASMGAGAVDNGKPGPRPNYTKNYYACFVLDPDGNNIEVMHDVWPSM